MEQKIELKPCPFCGMADMRAWLEVYEKHGLPVTMRPEILQRAVNIYGKEAQTDMAIEEMSELSKALLKHRRAEKSPEAWDYEQTKQSIYEEIADVVIMLTQLVIIYGGREEIQKDIESKVTRLTERLDKAEREAGAHTAQEAGMAKYINAEALIEELEAGGMPIYWSGISGIPGDRDCIRDYIERAPAADVRPERCGQWELVSDDDQDEGCYFCSQCKKDFYSPADDYDMLPNFCPN